MWLLIVEYWLARFVWLLDKSVSAMPSSISYCKITLRKRNTKVSKCIFFATYCKTFFYKLHIFGAQSQLCFLRSASFSSFISRSFWFRYLKGTLIRIFQTDTPYGCVILIHKSNATWKLGCIPAALSGPVFPNRDDWLPSRSQGSLLLALQACKQSVIRLRFRVCRLDVQGQICFKPTPYKFLRANEASFNEVEQLNRGWISSAATDFKTGNLKRIAWSRCRTKKYVLSIDRRLFFWPGCILISVNKSCNNLQHFPLITTVTNIASSYSLKCHPSPTPTFCTK